MPIELISTSEAARRLGMEPRTVRRWLVSGRLNGRKLGENGHWRIEWDSSIAGGAIMSPVNKFVSKTCIRHGGTKVSEVGWARRGSVGQELKITVHGATRKDAIAALRKISGGMTMDEIASIGVCTQCEGYKWVDDERLPARRAVHGQRENLNREDSPRTVKVLEKILKELQKIPRTTENPFVWRPVQPVVAPSQPRIFRRGDVTWDDTATDGVSIGWSAGTTSAATFDLSDSNVSGDYSGIDWEGAMVTITNQDTGETFTAPAVNGHVTFENNSVENISGNYSFEVEASDGSIYANNLQLGPILTDATDIEAGETVTVAQSGIFFLPMDTSNIEVGIYMTPEQLREQLRRDHTDDEGVFIQADVSPGSEPGEYGMFCVMGKNIPVEVRNNTGEGDVEWREDPATIEEQVETKFQEMVAEKATRRLEDDREFYMPVIAGDTGHIVRNTLRRADHMTISIEGQIHNRAIYITRYNMESPGSEPFSDLSSVNPGYNIGRT